MSREQRRIDRKAQKASGAAGGPPSRRTPVKVGGGRRFPIVPIGVAGSVIAIILLIVYLVMQSGKGTGPTGYAKAEADSSTSIPGTYVPSQGRGHEPGTYTPGRPPTPFCDGVAHSGSDAAAAATPTVQPSSTPEAAATSTTPGATPTVQTTCYNSNPPSSGMHLNVQNKVDIGGGNILPRIPPDPNVYPPEVEVPRDAIPHILEHAGVFVGYNCKSGDSACEDIVKKLTDMVNDRIDNHSDRVVMAHDSDLPENSFGTSSWTRVLNQTVENFNISDFEKFIAKNSCRYNPESFPC
jgi:hypothetical protein